MLESLLLGRRGGMATLVDIDFTSAQLGSTAIVDKGSLGITYTRGRKSGTTGDGVVDVAGKGRAYFFDGATYFTGNKIPVMYNKVFKMTAEVMMTGAGSVVATGAYPDYNGIRSGYALHGGQYTNQYIQYFMVDASGNYRRVLLDGALPTGQIDKLVIERFLDGSMAISAPNRGNRNTYPAWPYNNIESYFMLGGSHSLDCFTGHLFSLKIEVQR